MKSKDRLDISEAIKEACIEFGRECGCEGAKRIVPAQATNRTADGGPASKKWRFSLLRRGGRCWTMVASIFPAFLILFFGTYAHATADHARRRPILKLPCVVTASGIIIFQAKLSSFSDTLNFLLDTGSDGTSLDSSLSEKYSLSSRLSRDSVNGIGGKMPVSFVDEQTLHVGKVSFANLRFHLVDYSFLSNRLGVEISGVLGKPFLQRYIIEIDYDNKLINFYDTDGFVPNDNGIRLQMTKFALPAINVVTLGQQAAEGKYIFDLGAEQNLMINRAFVHDQGMLDSATKMFPVECEGLGGGRQIFMTTLKAVRIGDYLFRDVPVSIFDDQTHVTRYPATSGIVGIGILRRFNIWLNYAAHEIRLQPNSHFDDPFHYAYTGLSLYAYGEQIYVSHVMKNSPGDRAGFMPDDQIVAVDGARVRSGSDPMFLVDHQIGSSKFLVIRNGKKIKLRLMVESILPGK